MYFKSLVMIVLIATCAQVNASEAEFTITPAVCVVQPGEVCRNGFIFRWRLPSPMKACIIRKSTQTTLYCSQPSINHQIELALELSKSETFLLQAHSYNKQQTVLVKSVVIEVRQAKRHIWSVF